MGTGGVAWTVVRAGTLTDRPPSGSYRAATDGLDRPGRLGRADLAGYLVSHLADPQTYGSDFSDVFPDRTELTEGNILSMDPPRHHRLRSLVSRAFTPRAIAALDGRIAELTTSLLDETDGRDEIELVSDLAYPLPVIVIAEMLGVPSADRPLFKTWADALLSRGESLREPRHAALHAVVGDGLEELLEELGEPVPIVAIIAHRYRAP